MGDDALDPAPGRRDPRHDGADPGGQARRQGGQPDEHPGIQRDERDVQHDDGADQGFEDRVLRERARQAEGGAAVSAAADSPALLPELPQKSVRARGGRQVRPHPEDDPRGLEAHPLHLSGQHGARAAFQRARPHPQLHRDAGRILAVCAGLPHRGRRAAAQHDDPAALAADLCRELGQARLFAGPPAGDRRARGGAAERRRNLCRPDRVRQRQRVPRERDPGDQRPAELGLRPAPCGHQQHQKAHGADLRRGRALCVFQPRRRQCFGGFDPIDPKALPEKLEKKEKEEGT